MTDCGAGIFGLDCTDTVCVCDEQPGYEDMYAEKIFAYHERQNERYRKATEK